jgi:3-oxoacyl-(acyl-carrier-protein) synthase
MSKVYINGVGCVSAQSTFEGGFLETLTLQQSGNLLPLVAPPYKEYIPTGLIRRMGSAVKNGVVASAIALKEAGSPILDAIVTGTGVGCIRDSEIFLSAIIQNKEEFLTPTAFIQSTHNTVGGQIALGLGCKAYNLTYVQAAASFESALLDALLQVKTEEARNVLVGGVDERADKTYEHFLLAGLIKNNQEPEGATYSEGASFFVLGDQKEEQTYAVLKDVFTYNRLEPGEIKSTAEEFLSRNGLTIEDVDAVILGRNDDTRDSMYFDAFQEIFDTPSIKYKMLSGEYNTSSAFGFWVGAKVLKEQIIPAGIQLNHKTKEAYQHVLLYNQYLGKDHSFILLSRC